MMKGLFNISRPQSNADDHIRLVLTDINSQMKVVEVEFNPHDLMMALTGLSYQKCDFEIKNLDRFGKIREYKEVCVPRPKNRNDNQSLIPHEVDGWVGRKSDLHNHHRVVGDMVNVGFERWTVPEQ